MELCPATPSHKYLDRLLSGFCFVRARLWKAICLFPCVLPVSINTWLVPPDHRVPSTFLLAALPRGGTSSCTPVPCFPCTRGVYESVVDVLEPLPGLVLGLKSLKTTWFEFFDSVPVVVGSPCRLMWVCNSVPVCFFSSTRFPCRMVVPLVGLARPSHHGVRAWSCLLFFLG